MNTFKIFQGCVLEAHAAHTQSGDTVSDVDTSFDSDEDVSEFSSSSDSVQENESIEVYRIVCVSYNLNSKVLIHDFIIIFQNIVWLIDARRQW